MNKIILFFILINFRELVIFSKYKELPFQNKFFNRIKKDQNKKIDLIKKVEFIDHFLKNPKKMNKNNFQIQKEIKIIENFLKKHEISNEFLKTKDFNSNILSHKIKYKKIFHKKNSQRYNKIN